MNQTNTTNPVKQDAPMLTPEHVAAQVVSVAYHRFSGTTVTVCCVTLRNGFNTIGHSACVSPENFDPVVGEQIAYKNALNEIWPLEGYLLSEFMYMNREVRGQANAVKTKAHEDAYEVTGMPPPPEKSPAADFYDEQLKRPPESAWPSPPQPNSDSKEPAPTSQSGQGGDYAGAGATGSWDAPGTPSTDSGGSCSSDSGSSGSSGSGD
jgi:hypothetical protein